MKFEKIDKRMGPNKVAGYEKIPKNNKREGRDLLGTEKYLNIRDNLIPRILFWK